MVKDIPKIRQISSIDDAPTMVNTVVPILLAPVTQTIEVPTFEIIETIEVREEPGDEITVYNPQTPDYETIPFWHYMETCEPFRYASVYCWIENCTIDELTNNIYSVLSRGTFKLFDFYCLVFENFNLDNLSLLTYESYIIERPNTDLAKVLIKVPINLVEGLPKRNIRCNSSGLIKFITTTAELRDNIMSINSYLYSYNEIVKTTKLDLGLFDFGSELRGLNKFYNKLMKFLYYNGHDTVPKENDELVFMYDDSFTLKCVFYNKNLLKIGLRCFLNSEPINDPTILAYIVGSVDYDKSLETTMSSMLNFLQDSASVLYNAETLAALGGLIANSQRTVATVKNRRERIEEDVHLANSEFYSDVAGVAACEGDFVGDSVFTNVERNIYMNTPEMAYGTILNRSNTRRLMEDLIECHLPSFSLPSIPTILTLPTLPTLPTIDFMSWIPEALEISIRQLVISTIVFTFQEILASLSVCGFFVGNLGNLEALSEGRQININDLFLKGSQTVCVRQDYNELMSNYGISKLLDDVSLLLSPSELNNLLSGNGTNETYSVIRHMVNNVPEYGSLISTFGTETQIVNLFKTLEKFVDKKHLQIIVNQETRPITDLCLDEPQEIQFRKNILSDKGIPDNIINEQLNNAREKRAERVKNIIDLVQVGGGLSKFDQGLQKGFLKNDPSFVYMLNSTIDLLLKGVKDTFSANVVLFKEFVKNNLDSIKSRYTTEFIDFGEIENVSLGAERFAGILVNSWHIFFNNSSSELAKNSLEEYFKRVEGDDVPYYNSVLGQIGEPIVNKIRTSVLFDNGEYESVDFESLSENIDNIKDDILERYKNSELTHSTSEKNDIEISVLIELVGLFVRVNIYGLMIKTAFVDSQFSLKDVYVSDEFVEQIYLMLIDNISESMLQLVGEESVLKDIIRQQLGNIGLELEGLVNSGFANSMDSFLHSLSIGDVVFNPQYPEDNFVYPGFKLEKYIRIDGEVQKIGENIGDAELVQHGIRLIYVPSERENDLFRNVILANDGVDSVGMVHSVGQSERSYYFKNLSGVEWFPTPLAFFEILVEAGIDYDEEMMMNELINSEYSGFTELVGECFKLTRLFTQLKIYESESIDNLVGRDMFGGVGKVVLDAFEAFDNSGDYKD